MPDDEGAFRHGRHRCAIGSSTILMRQTTGFVESLFRLVGLDWAVPDFSTLGRRQKTLAVTIPYHGSEGPLNLLVDSTGIKVEGEGGGASGHRSGGSMSAPNGMPASTAARNAAYGARSTSASTNRRWRSVPSRVHWRLPLVRKSRWTGATSVVRPCCLSSSTRYLLMLNSAR